MLALHIHVLHAWAGATFDSLALGRFVFLPLQRDKVKKQVQSLIGQSCVLRCLGVCNHGQGMDAMTMPSHTFTGSSQAEWRDEHCSWGQVG